MIPPTKNPFELFQKWFRVAEKTSSGEHNAMALATVDKSGQPSCRQVLLKDFDSRGFTFFTNLDSRKALDIEVNKKGALLFYWPECHRQIRIEGTISRVSERDADAYFATRPRGSQIGAWISMQSRKIKDRKTLLANYQAMEKKFAGEEIPRPPYWGGYRLVPRRIEFWSGMPNRLHDRVLYTLKNTRWQAQRLQP